MVRSIGLIMDDFFIDKLGADCDDEDGKIETDEEKSFVTTPKIDLFDELPEKLKPKETVSKQKNFNTDNTYLITNYKDSNSVNNLPSSVNKLLEKSQCGTGLEKKHSIPLDKTKRALKLKRKKLAEKTKGKKWFDMMAPEMTEEIKTDFELLKMRSVLDKNHFYKKNDIKNIPKFFQVGKIVESAADFYGGRIPKSQRKKTMVEELLADAEFKKYQKKKFKEIMDENRRKKFMKKNVEKNKMKTKGNR